MDTQHQVQIPYFRDLASLPDALPTTEEILHSAAPGRCEAKKWASNNVGIVRGIYFVKFGPTVSINEGNTLVFLERNAPDIPAPRLHAMYDMLPDTLVLVMEYMPAANLRTVWKSLSSRAKESLTVELGDILKRMWQLPAPADFIGGISEDMGLALAEKSSENWEFHGQRGWKTDFFRRNLPSALSGHPFKLTHGDLHPANILVELDESGDKSGGNDGNNGNEAQYRVKAIVDWDTAGWYPEYWEYGINVALFPWDGDWIEALEEMIGAFPLQAAMLHMVRENIEF